ncbi:MAG: DCC1-like thiol-disulfide oxidoreductase family protein [Thermoplasmata archaeon]
MGRDLPAGPTLLFDGHCRVCRTFAALVSWWGVRRGLRVLPFQREEARRLLPDWTDDEVTGSAHLVLPQGEVLSGPRAFSALLDRLPAIGPLHQRLADRFPFPRIERAVYDVGVALRGAVQCANPGDGSTA